MLHDADDWPLLSPAAHQTAALPAGPPILLVTIDTEAEFDWRGPFLRSHTNVGNLRHQRRAQAIYDRFGVRPAYLVDYAVATQPEGFLPLREIVEAGRCEIGAHLHPWITPPFAEELSERASFSQNLPPAVQQEKLARLTEAIAAHFGLQPTCYRAGRLGIGEEIAGILNALGYQTDLSVLPGSDLRRRHGPDFRSCVDQPYWFGRGGRLLEIPETAAYTGLLAHPATARRAAVHLYEAIRNPAFDRLHVRGLLAGLGLLDHFPLSPEGAAIEDLRRITRLLLARGNRIFVLSYHSSSLVPGNTEYVRSEAELTEFLRRIEQYLEFFLGELGGASMTPSELRAALVHETAGAATAPALPVAAQ